MEIPKQK